MTLNLKIYNFQVHRIILTAFLNSFYKYSLRNNPIDRVANPLYSPERDVSGDGKLVSVHLQSQCCPRNGNHLFPRVMNTKGNVR